MSNETRRLMGFGLIGVVALVLVAAVAMSALGTSNGDDAVVPDAGDDAGANDQPTATPTWTPTPTATATPTPTPTPTPPPVVEHCYGEREADTVNFEILPARDRSVFQRCQIVMFYGHPEIPAMGVLGQATIPEMIERLRGEAAAFEATNGGRTVVPGFHIIAAVAHPFPTDTGTYLTRMDHALLERWIELAEEHDFLILIDLQMGHSTVDDELEYFLPHLRHPRVHLALDPEWAMRESGLAPGQRIGNMDASEINRAQEILQGLVDEYNLDNQILMIHQFQEQMIRNKDQLQVFPGVDLVIHMDGFGTPGQKIDSYNAYVRDDEVDHSGFKLFYTEDVGLMSADEVNRLIPQPDIITFQ